MNFLLVFLGGGIGSVARYAISVGMLRATPAKWAPLAATFGSNLIACIILAMIIRLQCQVPMSKSMFVLLTVGFCGGFSTFSTFSYETYYFWTRGEWGWALLNVLISVAVGLATMALLIRNGVSETV